MLRNKALFHIDKSFGRLLNSLPKSIKTISGGPYRGIIGNSVQIGNGPAAVILPLFMGNLHDVLKATVTEPVMGRQP